MKKFLLKIAKGIGVGISCMIPGVSGGTFALITRCYDDLVSNISTLFKKFGKSFLNLLPYAIGIVAGLLLAYFGIRISFSYVLFSIICLFDGMIMGSIYDLYLEVKDEKKTTSSFVSFVIPFILVILLSIGSMVLSLNGFSSASMFENPQWYLYVILFFVGALASFALVAPGVSGAMILLVLGFYSPILDTLHNLFHLNGNVVQNIFLIVSFCLGILVGTILVSKLMKFLLEKHKNNTYWAILGLVSASVIGIFFNKDIWIGNETYLGVMNNPKELFLGIPLLIAGFVLVFFLLKLSRKNKHD